MVIDSVDWIQFLDLHDSVSGHTLRQAVMEIKRVSKSAKRLFVWAERLAQHSEQHDSCCHPNLEPEAKPVIQALLPHIIHKHGQLLSASFDPSCISRMEEVKWDPQKKQAVSPRDTELQAVFKNDEDSDFENSHDLFEPVASHSCVKRTSTTPQLLAPRLQQTEHHHLLWQWDQSCGKWVLWLSTCEILLNFLWCRCVTLVFVLIALNAAAGQQRPEMTMKDTCMVATGPRHNTQNRNHKISHWGCLAKHSKKCISNSGLNISKHCGHEQWIGTLPAMCRPSAGHVPAMCHSDRNCPSLTLHRRGNCRAVKEATWHFDGP